MSNIHDYFLSFSIGELSCQFLRTSSGIRTVLGPPTSYLSHEHPFVELHYIIQGRCIYSTGEALYEVGPKQLLIIPPGVNHVLSQICSTMVHLTLSLHIQPLTGRSHGPSRSLYNALHAPTPFMLDVRAQSTLNEALDRIDALSRERREEFSVQESLRAYATLLMAALSESLVEQPTPVSAAPPHMFAPQSFLINQFFCDPSAAKGGATALAQMLNVSPRHLDRILLETYGMNFREKLNETKLNYATDLLSNRSLSIDQIAHLLGYSTSTAFSAFLKKSTGKTPSQLRQDLLSGKHDVEAVCSKPQ